MPVAVEATGQNFAWSIVLARWSLAAGAVSVPATSARCESGNLLEVTALEAITRLERHEYALLALALGVIVFAVLCAIALVRSRARYALQFAAFNAELAALRGAMDRTSALIASEPQLLLIWTADGKAPETLGDPRLLNLTDALDALAFDGWLEPEAAQEVASRLDRLRARGDGFASSLTTRDGKQIEAEGRVIGGCAVLRMREVSGVLLQLAEASNDRRRLQAHIESLHTLIETMTSPVWEHDADGRLSYVNRAYANAVEREPHDAIASAAELIDREEREEMRLSIAASGVYTRRLPVVVAGARRLFDVLGVKTAHGSAAIGVDVTEADALRNEVARMVDAHRSTLNQLATAVAIFDSQRRLTFYNTAYRALWDLDVDFLEQRPTDSAILEHLRAARRLPEQQDFRQWRTQLHEAYQALEPRQQEWYLPGGQTLRVVTTPNSEGGVTYLFDDVTERLNLERRYDALIRVQGETLDNLGEAVAVFASDGRLRLFNPAFERMWHLSREALVERPHVTTVVEWLRPLTRDDQVLQALHSSVTALESRQPMAQRVECRNGTILECSALPLPDAGTLVTFTDVTASVNVERALVERNEALIAADGLKEAFLQHMSYELRSPLTNIIGFAYFLGDPKTGPLNDLQREYLGYITYSTNALLAIVDNILDLATIEAGAMTLDLEPVDIRQTMQAAAEGVQDRLAKDGITLDLRTTPDIGSFVADGRRVRQVLFNLLSNAVGFSPRGSHVVLTAERRPDAIVFSVSDNGPGIPDDMKESIFGLFETHPLGSQHRGLGLGLSLVRSFVELHGGSVKIESAVGRGTTVTCIFPLQHDAARSAAE
jgi:signal transduction histidine kinase